MSIYKLVVSARKGVLKYPEKPTCINTKKLDSTKTRTVVTLAAVQANVDAFVRSNTFRPNELYDEDNDRISHGYVEYDGNDVPVADSLRPKLCKQPVDMVSKFFDYCKSPVATLIKTGKSVFEDNLYEHFMNTQQGWYANYMAKKLEQFDFRTVANIFHSSINYGCINTDFSDAAFSLIRHKYPLEAVLNMMDKAILRDEKGRKRLEPKMLLCMGRSPESLPYLITKNRLGYEYFDDTADEYVEDFLRVAKTSEDAYAALDSCRFCGKNGIKYADKRLCEFAIAVLSNNEGVWEEGEKSLCASLLNYREDECAREYQVLSLHRLKAAQKLLDEGKSAMEIRNCLLAANKN